LKLIFFEFRWKEAAVSLNVMKMDAARSSETLVTYITTLLHNPQYSTSFWRWSQHSAPKLWWRT